MKKKLIAALLTASMLLSWLPAPAVTAAPAETQTTVPEITVPETTVPETTAPETTVPETTVPETTVPETTVPETTVPETTAPETTVPETTVPETTAPEPTVPQSPLLEDLPEISTSAAIPENMLHNSVLDYMEGLGYAVSALRDAGVLYDAGYISVRLPAPYRTGIPYGTDGMVCADFVADYIFKHLPKAEGIPMDLLLEGFNGSLSYVPDLHALLEKAAGNYAYYSPSTNKQVQVIKKDVADLQIGDILFYGDQHCAIYLGQTELTDVLSGSSMGSAEFVAHCGTNRGPEIATNAELAAGGLIPTAAYSIQSVDDIAYFYLDDDDRASNVVIAHKKVWSFGGAVDYEYWSHEPYLHPIFRNGSINNCSYFELENGMVAYCVEPWVLSTGGSGSNFHETSWGDAVYNNDQEKYNTVRKILSVGAHSTSAPEAFKRATALFVWDAICGYWNSNIKRTGIGEPPFLHTEAKGSDVRDAYETISSRIQFCQKKPSFTSTSATSAPVITLNFNPSSGLYEGYAQDSEEILHDYKFDVPITGLNYQYLSWDDNYGFRVKVTATPDAAREIMRRNGVTLSGEGYYYDFSSQEVKVFGNWSDDQKFGTLASDASPVRVYFAVDVILADQAITLQKQIKADQTIIDQLKGNACYTLEGAEYSVYKDGILQEVMVTDSTGAAKSSKKYQIGTTLTIKETKAPKGFKLDPDTHTITLKDNMGAIKLSDEPAFDPRAIVFEKKDPITGQTVPQGNAKFEGAVFKWEYYDNQDWSGTPTRTWYFQTNAAGQHGYDPRYLAAEYNSDPLYLDKHGDEKVPIGSVKITEIKAPAGYGQIQTLYANITQPTNGSIARFRWTPESAAIVESKDGKYLFPEPVDATTYGSLSIQKTDALTGGNPPAGYEANFEGCEFTIYNNSKNPVKIGDFPTAAPGEACYVLTVDAEGKASTGDIFPMGSYTIKETKGNAYYTPNTDWSQEFEIGNGTLQGFATVANRPVMGSILLQKTDAISGTPLTGAVFEVTFPDGSKQNMVELADGQHRLDDLRYGTYTVQEVKAPEGFEPDPTVYTVDITEDGRVYEIHTDGHTGIANSPKPGSISVRKTDTFGNPMEGVSFKLEFSVDDGGTWAPIQSREPDALLLPGTTSTQGVVDGILVTPASGEIAFEGLRINSQLGNVKYRLTEVETTNGHTLMGGTAFEGYLDDTHVDISIHAVNGAAFELPVSGAVTRLIVPIAGIALLGAAWIISRKKNKEAKK